MTRSDGHHHADLELEAIAARTRLVGTLDELELRRERAMAKVRWLERRVVPALLLAVAGGSLLVSYLLFRRRPVIVRIARPGSALQTGLSLAISSAVLVVLQTRPVPQLPAHSSPSLAGKLPDYR